jgi:hypothetical protein
MKDDQRKEKKRSVSASINIRCTFHHEGNSSPVRSSCESNVNRGNRRHFKGDAMWTHVTDCERSVEGQTRLCKGPIDRRGPENFHRHGVAYTTSRDWRLWRM